MATAVKSKPILFSGPMVKAILDGRKTMTRRIVKPQPDESCWFPADARLAWSNGVQVEQVNGKQLVVKRCHYGQAGDRLWVREQHWFRKDDGITAYFDGSIRTHITAGFPNHYCPATKPPPDDWPNNHKELGFRSVPSIHMPRWASRITLEITGVRVERLQEISNADAEAEGVRATEWAAKPLPLREQSLSVVKLAFSHLWESINGKGSWEANPWVWAIAFRRLEPPHA